PRRIDRGEHRHIDITPAGCLNGGGGLALGARRHRIAIGPDRALGQKCGIFLRGGQGAVRRHQREDHRAPGQSLLRIARHHQTVLRGQHQPFGAHIPHTGAGIAARPIRRLTPAARAGKGGARLAIADQGYTSRAYQSKGIRHHKFLQSPSALSGSALAQHCHKGLLCRSRPPTGPRGNPNAARKARNKIARNQHTGIQFDRNLRPAEQGQTVAVEQQLPDCHDRPAFDGDTRRLGPQRAQHCLPMTAQRGFGTGQDPGIPGQFGPRLGHDLQRMPLAHHQHRRIGKHRLTRQPFGLGPFAQGAQHQVDFTITQGARELTMTALDHHHAHAGIFTGKPADRLGQPARAGQGHGSHDDAPRRLALPCRHLGQSGAQFSHRKAKPARAALSGGGQRNMLPAPVHQPLTQRYLQIGHRAVKAGRGQARRLGRPRVTARAGQSQQGAQLGSGDARAADMINRGLGARGHQQRRFGGRHALRAAFKQGHAKARFKASNSLRQRGLGQIHGAGGARQAAMAHRRGQRCEMADIERAIPDSIFDHARAFSRNL
ncbi:hypothetical protein E4T56_gene15795, partial [Termitomyces sp. T112]